MKTAASTGVVLAVHLSIIIHLLTITGAGATCGGTFQGKNGTIAFRVSGDEQTVNCTWTVVVKPNSRVQLRFTKVPTNCPDDQITVFDGTMASNNVLMDKFCGNSKGNDIGVLKSTSNRVTIHFTSNDVSRRRSRFTLRWKAVKMREEEEKTTRRRRRTTSPTVVPTRPSRARTTKIRSTMPRRSRRPTKVSDTTTTTRPTTSIQSQTATKMSDTTRPTTSMQSQTPTKMSDTTRPTTSIQSQTPTKMSDTTRPTASIQSQTPTKLSDVTSTTRPTTSIPSLTKLSGTTMATRPTSEPETTFKTTTVSKATQITLKTTTEPALTTRKSKSTTSAPSPPVTVSSLTTPSSSARSRSLATLTTSKTSFSVPRTPTVSAIISTTLAKSKTTRIQPQTTLLTTKTTSIRVPTKHQLGPLSTSSTHKNTKYPPNVEMTKSTFISATTTKATEVVTMKTLRPILPGVISNPDSSSVRTETRPTNAHRAEVRKIEAMQSIEVTTIAGIVAGISLLVIVVVIIFTIVYRNKKMKSAGHKILNDLLAAEVETTC